MSTQWQTELANAVHDPAELLRMLELDPALLEPAQTAGRQFSLRVPRAFVARMRKGDAADPLLHQVLPLGEELRDTPGFDSDPVGDLHSRQRPGVLHKYHGRVLLITTGACGVHCRYCFRRYFPYEDETARRDHWREALEYLRTDESISEVILSGGDPLTLTDQVLTELVVALQRIPHIKRLRIHTRQPIVLPSRVDESLLTWLGNCRLQKVVVLHVNHARELDAAVVEALSKLRGTGATLFSQSVLLRGVNNSVETLAALSEALFATGVVPYYLHLLDRVRGAAHFEVSEDEAGTLVGGLRARLPGYLVPRLVREIPGAPSKVPLADAPWPLPETA
ncbi:MAG: EF-P beta-lysylation protein EpmB [Gammaproteobacteria bacterium]